jgi:hypothetical protein
VRGFHFIAFWTRQDSADAPRQIQASYLKDIFTLAR